MRRREVRHKAQRVRWFRTNRCQQSRQIIPSRKHHESGVCMEQAANCWILKGSICAWHQVTTADRQAASVREHVIVKHLLNQAADFWILNGTFSGWIQATEAGRQERRDAFVDAIGSQLRASKRLGRHLMGLCSRWTVHSEAIKRFALLQFSSFVMNAWHCEVSQQKRSRALREKGNAWKEKALHCKTEGSDVVLLQKVVNAFLLHTYRTLQSSARLPEGQTGPYCSAAQYRDHSQDPGKKPINPKESTARSSRSPRITVHAEACSSSEGKGSLPDATAVGASRPPLTLGGQSPRLTGGQQTSQGLRNPFKPQDRVISGTQGNMQVGPERFFYDTSTYTGVARQPSASVSAFASEASMQGDPTRRGCSSSSGKSQKVPARRSGSASECRRAGHHTHRRGCV